MTEHVRPSCSTGKLRILIRSSLFSYLILPLVLLQLCSNLASAGSPVKFLPGFEGPLPFELETGYIGVDESEDVQLFYYFVKSESSPETDPLVLWLSGGNCCTSFSGLAYEIGPIKFEQVLYHGTLPKLLLNPYSWTKVASIIFVDLPVASGFSYARTAKASQSTVLQACNQAYEFLRKWLVDHPEFISSPVYIGGDSKAGISVPIVTQLISDGNAVGIEPHIDLKGYILGNPVTTPGDGNYAIQFTHGMGLISDELYESLKLSCKGEYQNIDPSNALCLQNMEAYNQLLSNINKAHILEPYCPYASPKPNNLFTGRRSTIQVFCEKTRELKIQELAAPFTCRRDGYRLVYHWANDESVQEALHVRKGSIGEWIRCNCRYPFIRNIGNSLPYHANLSIRGYRSLIYSGDHDMVVPHFGTQAWVKSLNYSIIDDWRQWILQGQVAGYTRTYANEMTFATVKGGGHIAPEYKPAECRAMFESQILLALGYGLEVGTVDHAMYMINCQEGCLAFISCEIRCIGVDESEDVQLICYLVKSGSDPMDLLVVCLSQGLIRWLLFIFWLAYEIGELLSHCIALSTTLPHPVFENGIGPYYLISPPHSKPVKRTRKETRQLREEQSSVVYQRLEVELTNSFGDTSSDSDQEEVTMAHA